MDDKEDKDMAALKEDVKKIQELSARQKLIREMTLRACEKNDAGLRRLSET